MERHISPGHCERGQKVKASFPLIQLKGSYFEIGLAHGRSLASEIRDNLSLYYNMVEGLTGLDKEQALKRSLEFLSVVQENAPHLTEEMEGISRGAGIPLEAVMLLNARTELMSSKVPGGECTAVGLTADRVEGGRPLLAQNWDWHHAIRKGSALFLVTPPQGPRCLYLAEAGQLGKIGLNENGLGVLLNILFSGQVQNGLPVHIMLRLILEAGRVAEAIRLVKNAVKASSSHFLLGDAKGNIVGLELWPGGVAEIGPTQGVVLHTNHFCGTGSKINDEGLTLFPDTIPRIERAGAFLSQKKRWSADGLKEMFVNHQDGPASICRHVAGDAPEFMRMETIASLVLDLRGKTMEVTAGQPCRNSYQTMSL
jgi:isopenicillin-N N-acyltransferase-like protein